jgi:multidrug resistance efflux pump
MSASDPTGPMPALMALLQLGRRARAADSPETLGFVIVNETLQLAAYRQAALWTELGLGRVAAVSGLPQPDPTAPYVQWLGAVFRHQMRQNAEAGPVDVGSLPELVRAEWAQWLPAHALWLPLGRGDGAEGAVPLTTEGGLLLARDAPWTAHDIALLKELAPVYGHALASFRPRQRTHHRLLGWLRTGKARRRLLLATLVLCLVPVRLTVLAPAEVSPTDPFMVRAPLDGVIERFDVQPNQAVQPGTPLFSLDTTALRTRLELARQAFDTAQEEYRQTAQSAVTSDKNRAEIALRRGKLQEKAVELDYTSEQFQRVQVKSDRAGMAVFTDANDWVGRAVTVGERILLVADPARVELTAWLPTSDPIDVKPGDRVAMYPQGAPLSPFEAKVISVAYRAEVTPEGFLAYRIKAAFDAGQPMPRIGQTGTARLQGRWAPLAYVALRRPLGVMRQWLGW